MMWTPVPLGLSSAYDPMCSISSLANSLTSAPPLLTHLSRSIPQYGSSAENTKPTPSYAPPSQHATASAKDPQVCGFVELAFDPERGQTGTFLGFARPGSGSYFQTTHCGRALSSDARSPKRSP